MKATLLVLAAGYAAAGVILLYHLREMARQDDRTPIRGATKSLRCTICGESWPPFEEFRECPVHAEKCDTLTNDGPTMSDEEAFRRRSYALFDRYLENTGREDLIEA